MSSEKLSAFQFTNPLLMNMQFSVNKDYQDVHENEGIDIPIGMKVSRPDIANCKDKTALVLLAVTVGQEGVEYPYYVTVEMGANFRWDDSVENEMVEKLLSRNAPALLLGYIRPYIAQITEASPIGAVHLPFMNFIPQSD